MHTNAARQEKIKNKRKKRKKNPAERVRNDDKGEQSLKGEFSVLLFVRDN